MTRLQRIAAASALVNLLLIVLSGVLRLTGSGAACGNLLNRCEPGWAIGPLSGAGLGVVQVLLVTLATGLVLATALFGQRVVGVSRRTRWVVWATAALFASQLLVELAVTAGLMSSAFLVLTPMLGMVMLGLSVVAVWSVANDAGEPGWLARAGQSATVPRDAVLVNLTRLSVAALFLVIVSGAVTGGASTSLPCSSWPLCVDGGVLPAAPASDAVLQMTHRVLTALASVVLLATAFRVLTRPATRQARDLTLALLALLVVQILLGGNFVAAGGPVWLSVLHLVASVALWLLVISLAVVAIQAARMPAPVRASSMSSAVSSQPAPVQMRATPAPDGAIAMQPGVAALDLSLPDPTAARSLVADYVALMKPGILSLLLFTTFTAMLIAASGLPSLPLIIVTLIGGVLVAGGANVLNCYVDHDIDAIMGRTKHRASASGRIPLRHVLIFGLSLTAVAVLLLGFGANWLAAGLALAGNVYYVLVYTKWLKRRTPQNIVIGGAAGAVPPLVGWAAVTGSLSPIAWMLFLIIFAWTPPHSWALALLKQGEYGRAAVPMLPVVAGEAATRRQIVIYSALLFLVCLALVPLGLGPIFLVATLVINGVFLGLALVLYFRPAKRHARQLFFFSLWYLALIFMAAVIDRLLLG